MPDASRLLLFLVLLCGAMDGAEAADESSPWLGTWRITHGVAAPWADSSTPVTAGFVGRTLTLTADRSEGPGVLACSKARIEPTSMPAEGLFQGNLPQPAANAAVSVGLARFPVEGFSLSCTSGLFEFHAAEPNSVLLALDNVIWTLDRSFGTQAPADSPEGLVQALLEVHFAGDMGFLPATVSSKQAWLSASLRASIDTYFARPRPEDEVPPIDGDPFTDSQEYPFRFAVRSGHADGPGYVVPVDFADSFQQKRVVFRLLSDAGAWRIDDISYEHGTLREMLAL